MRVWVGSHLVGCSMHWMVWHPLRQECSSWPPTTWKGEVLLINEAPVPQSRVVSTFYTYHLWKDLRKGPLHKKLLSHAHSIIIRLVFQMCISQEWKQLEMSNKVHQEAYQSTVGSQFLWHFLGRNVSYEIKQCLCMVMHTPVLYSSSLLPMPSGVIFHT